MAPSAAPWTGFRRAALPLTLVLLLLPATAVRAQRLLTLVPGVGAASSADGPGPSIGPLPTAVQVDLELLRSGPAWLETPTPDGSVLWAERSVFEERGGGDLMWSGGNPDAGYDTVVLTVEGGRLVGRFAAAGGGAYQIHTERDGRGGMAPVGGPRPLGPDGTSEPFCAVETAEPDALHAAAHARAGAPAAEPLRAAEPQNHDRLDILVAYTATAAENWADRGGAQAAIRHAGDYLKMVFRNNELPVEPHIVHVAQASAELDRAGRDLGFHEFSGSPLWAALNRDGELSLLRHEHRADIVHLFTGEQAVLEVCGSAHLLLSETAEDFSARAYGWSTNDPAMVCSDYAVIFAHEVGHNLGAHHDAGHLGFVPELLFRPYSVGYVNHDMMPTLGTAMSVPGQIEPFFSTPRIRPWGAAVGVVSEADNERRLRETAHIGVRYSDYLASIEGLPAPPSELRVRLEGGAAHLSWRDNAPDADGYEVGYRWHSSQRGWNRKIRVEGRSEATVRLELTVPGTRHDFEVRALKGEARSLRSSRVLLVVPGEPLEAPSGVSVAVWGNNKGVRVRWNDNSDNESGFDVQLLRDGETIDRTRAAADSGLAEFSWAGVKAQGAEYGVRVFAYNSSGYSPSSETASFRWEHPDAPGPIAGVSASAIGPTTVRVAWTVDPEVDKLYYVYASLPNWHDRRILWYPSPAGPAGAAWMDFEDLARGGRYRFGLVRENEQGKASLPSLLHLTLGERAAGPEAPSDLSVATMSDGRIRLGWRDNSSDESGFEVQLDASRIRSWGRELTVSADTESVVFEPSVVLSPVKSDMFRVFAYNELGYSAGSAHLPRLGSCKASDVVLCLRESRFYVKMVWRTVGESGLGKVVHTGSDESGLFHFFDPENWEALIKVLDGCSINGRMWVLGASTTDLWYEITVYDTITGELRQYWNAPGQPAPAIVDTEAFSKACGAAGAASASSSGATKSGAPAWRPANAGAFAPVVVAERMTGQTEAGGTALYLQDRRLRASVIAVALDGERHEGRVARIGTNKSGLFYFFDPENWEVLLKVLDGCAINGHYWVLAASATDLGLDLRVEDTATGGFRTYDTEPGKPAPAIVDTEALACAAGAATQ